MHALRIGVAFVAAVIAATLLGSAFSTLDTLARLAAIGADIPPALRAQTVLFDWTSMAPAYGAIIAIAFAVAMLLPRLILGPGPAVWAYALAGFLAVIAALVVMQVAFFGMGGIVPIAGARSWLGLLAQGAAGAGGGLAFGLLRPLPRP